jgi:hypothetical protein
MNMRKLSLSLLIIAGLMNSTWCTVGEQIVTEQELRVIADLLRIKDEIMLWPEYIAVEQAMDKRAACIKKTLEVFLLCSAQGNCQESVELRLAIDEQEKAEVELIVALEQWASKIKMPVEASYFILLNRSAFK